MDNKPYIEPEGFEGTPGKLTFRYASGNLFISPHIYADGHGDIACVYGIDQKTLESNAAIFAHSKELLKDVQMAINLVRFIREKNTLIPDKDTDRILRGAIILFSQTINAALGKKEEDNERKS